MANTIDCLTESHRSCINELLKFLRYHCYYEPARVHCNVVSTGEIARNSKKFIIKSVTRIISKMACNINL